MKIIEILQKDVNEKISDIFKSKKTVGKDVANIGRGLVKGVGDFIQGAGGPDIGAAVDKYGGDTTDRLRTHMSAKTDKGPRGVASDSGLDQILASMYGADRLDDDIVIEWQTAIDSGNADKIKAVNNKYEEKLGILAGAQSTEFPGKLKNSHKEKIAQLAGIDVSELGDK